jgi:hypothetical protein
MYFKNTASPDGQSLRHEIREGRCPHEHGQCCFSILKRGTYGIYQHVSEAHRKRHLAEFDFRYSYRIKSGFDNVARFGKALAGIVVKRLTYRTVGGKRPTQAFA